MHSLEISGGCLSVQLLLHKEKNGDLYGVLNCGPDDTDDDVVVIPLHALSSESSEYIRPKYHRVHIRNKKSLEGSPKLIYIQKDQASGNGQLANRRHWFYFEESIETNLELIDVQPRLRWQKNHGMIVTANESGSDVTERSLTRFRAKESGCSDVVVILEFTLSKAQPSARFHVMTCSTDTDLDDLGSKLQYMRRQAFGKQSASNGRFNVKATVAEMSVAGQRMFVLRLATAETISEPTVDATMELSQVNIVLELINLLQLEQTRGQLDVAQSELTAELQRRKQRLIVVEEEIRKLIEEKEVLQKALQAGDSVLVQHGILDQDKDAFKKWKRDYCAKLRDLLDKDSDAYSGPGQWIEVVAEMLVNSSDMKIDLDADDVAKRNSVTGQNTAKAAKKIVKVHQQTTPTLEKKERQAIIKLLQEKSVKIVPKDWKGTALGWIAANGLRSVVQLHRQIYQERQLAIGSKQNLSYQAPPGANVPGQFSPGKLAGDGIDEADEDGRTPLSYAAGGGHKGIIEILLDGGAFIDSKDRKSRTPLSHASMCGHEDVVNLLLDRGADRLALEKVDKVADLPQRLSRISPPTRIEAGTSATQAHTRKVKNRPNPTGFFQSTQKKAQ